MRAILTSGAIVVFMAATVGFGYELHLRLGQEALGQWGSYLAGAGTIGLVVGGWYAARDAVRQYAEKTRDEQTRWVAELFKTFFEDDLYRSTRQKVDYDDLDDIVVLLEKNKLPNASFSPDERNTFDAFTDFLNFFEMFAFLTFERRISEKDVDQMFNYYLRRFWEIKASSAVMEYLKKDGFDNLLKLLVKYKPPAKTPDSREPDRA